MAHHGTYTQLGCRWLAMGLTHNSDADGSPRELHNTRMPMAHHRTYTHLGCRWLTTGLTHPSNADGSPWELHTPRIPMAHHETHTLLGCRCLTTGLTHNSPAGSTSVRAPDNMDNYLVPLSHTVLPITLSTTTTTYAQVPSLGFQTQIETPCNQQTTYGVSSWFTLCIYPPPSSSG
jgi:hypothetical protein